MATTWEQGHVPLGRRADLGPAQLAITAELGSLRRRHPALRHGDWAPLWWEGDGLAFLRTHEGERALVVLTRADPPPPIRLELPAASPTVLWGAAP